MALPTTWDFGLDSRIVSAGKLERAILVFLFICIYVSYGALFRDIFFNRLNYTAAEYSGDTIGSMLFYARFIAVFAGFGIVVGSSGFTWATSKIPLMFAPFCMFALLSSMWAEDWKVPIRNGISLMSMWIGMSVIIHRIGVVQAVRSTIHLIAVVVISSAALAIFVPSIGVHTGDELFQSVHAGRWRGIFGHKNGLGPWAAYGSVFLFTHSRLCSGPRAYFWIARVSALACLMMSGAATSQVAALGLVTFLAWLRLGRKIGFQGASIVAIAIVVPIGFAAYLASDAMFSLINRDSGLTGRTDVWPIAIEFFRNSPWLGYGSGTLGGPTFLGLLASVFGQDVPGPESGYLTVLLEVGILGALSFFIPYIIAIRNGIEWTRHVHPTDRSALEFLLAIMFSTFIFAVTESNALIATGFDGVIAFTAFFAMLTTPRSPTSVSRRDFRRAENW